MLVNLNVPLKFGTLVLVSLILLLVALLVIVMVEVVLLLTPLLVNLRFTVYLNILTHKLLFISKMEPHLQKC